MPSTVVGMLAVLLGCSPVPTAAGEGGNRLQSEVLDEDSGNGTTATTAGPVESATAETFRAFLQEIDDVPPDIDRFAMTVSDEELEQLATTACGLIEPDMTAAELGTASFSARDQLGEEHRALLDIADFGVVFGILAGLRCPQRLPIGGDRPVERPDQSAIDGYRQAAPSFWPDEHPATRFVAMVSDDRIHQLQQSACAFSSVDQSGAEFGSAVIAHYRAELTVTERATIEIGTYPEIYGSLVGWFCPQRLPDIG